MSSLEPLHVDELGEGGPLIVLVHGLFGHGRNWNTVAKALAVDHRVRLVDLPHHGRSPWADSFDFGESAEQLAALLDPADPATLVGHSLGGKVSMVTALLHPDRVHRLCVSDIAPVAYDNTREFAGYVEAMKALDLTTIDRRQAADDAVAEAVPNRTVRAFLLQNLRRDDDGWRWQVNLDVIERDLETIGGWPGDLVDDRPPYDGSVLWVAGELSPYVGPEHEPAMERYFPRARKVVVKGAGHWLHAEKPDVFTEVVGRFARA